MTHPDVTQRPSASAILQEQVLSRSGIKSKIQLRKELNLEKFKNDMLSK